MNNDPYNYTYCAEGNEEVKRIREKYLPKEESKLEQLRRMDASVTRKATMVSILIGVSGCLILGSGMSMCMVVGGRLFVPGIVVGLIGLALLAMAYPVYGKVLKKERQRIAPEILRLSEELLK